MDSEYSLLAFSMVAMLLNVALSKLLSVMLRTVLSIVR